MAEVNGVKTIPYYMIISKCSGMALDAKEESVRMFFPLNTPLQHWGFEDRGNGYVTIINRGSHQVLDVDMAGVDNGTVVHMWQDVNAANQLWVLEPAGKNTYRIRAKHSKRYLDICGQSLLPDARLNIWDSTSSDTQLWVIQEVIEEPKLEVLDEKKDAEPKRRRRKTAVAPVEETPVKKTRKPRKPRAKKASGEAAPAVEPATEAPVAETPKAPEAE